ncbi:MAG: hypothetical protein US96_C0018G0012 [Candidatus Woesebacteria bacterium GW2011_GWB1_38_5b]|uniref:Uncharacterized protein n=1 Tax=Candidatus Woesebacteria bacterium GW2011_GWB1_38_5b TaxID=1618569 RepID=A0A0G0KHL9_9BACT|nr:MAG: hypothetical protein US96_C0018G0012 [Candidatus Woesebacteria bacterium GW2011_GWB1_38_5b]
MKFKAENIVLFLLGGNPAYKAGFFSLEDVNTFIHLSN